jgi:hypothetical protein
LTALHPFFMGKAKVRISWRLKALRTFFVDRRQSPDGTAVATLRSALKRYYAFFNQLFYFLPYYLKTSIMKLLKPATLFLAIALLFTACTSNEIGESKDVAQDKIYQSYSVNYTEGETTAEVFSQFRFAGRNGTTLILSTPSQLQFDGEKIKVDSGDYSGAYYKIFKPAAGFYGKHSFAFTTTDNKTYTNSFSFDGFRLVNVPATASKTKDLFIPFETPALRGDDYISIEAVNTDSSFSISHNYADGNAVKIPAEYLKKQTGNLLTLEARIVRKPVLQQTTAEGGTMMIEQHLKPVKIMLNQ